MTKRWSLVTLCGLLALACLPPAMAQAGPGPERDTLAEQLAGLNRSLERLVVLLESSLENQKVDLLLKRINLRERRLAPLESELRSSRNAIADSESETAYLKQMQEQHEETLTREIREGLDRPDSETRAMMAGMESALKMQSQRLEKSQLRIRELEDELAEGREQIAVLDDMLEELLE